MIKNPEQPEQKDLFKTGIEILGSTTEVNEKGIGSCIIDAKIRGRREEIIVIRNKSGFFIPNAIRKMDTDQEAEFINYADNEFAKKIKELQIEIGEKSLKEAEAKDKGIPYCKICDSYHRPEDGHDFPPKKKVIQH